MGDVYYSPLVVGDNVANGTVWNAPIVASDAAAAAAAADDDDHHDHHHHHATAMAEYLNQLCDMDAIPPGMASEAYEYLYPKVVTVYAHREQTVVMRLVPGFFLSRSRSCVLLVGLLRRPRGRVRGHHLRAEAGGDSPRRR